MRFTTDFVCLEVGGGGGGGKSHGPLYFKLFLLHVTFTYYYNKNKLFIITCK